MTADQWIVVAYFSVLIIGAWVVPVPMTRKLRATALGAGVLVVLAMAQSAAPGLRAWLPHFYLVAGYWLPALLVPVSPGRRFEEWLLRRDLRWRRALPTVPGWLIPPLELAYLLCYPLVPVAFAIVWTNGNGRDVERFWFAVLLAGYSCYGTLPWLVSRPPRLVDDRRDIRGSLAAANSHVLSRVSHQFNTFPSGHVAVAASATAAVAIVSPLAGAILGIVVVAIGVGAAAGRYHYVEDAFWGLMLAGVAHLFAAAV